MQASLVTLQSFIIKYCVAVLSGNIYSNDIYDTYVRKNYIIIKATNNDRKLRTCSISTYIQQLTTPVT